MVAAKNTLFSLLNHSSSAFSMEAGGETSREAMGRRTLSAFRRMSLKVDGSSKKPSVESPSEVEPRLAVFPVII